MRQASLLSRLPSLCSSKGEQFDLTNRNIVEIVWLHDSGGQRENLHQELRTARSVGIDFFISSPTL